jgi:hypothetical protein
MHPSLLNLGVDLSADFDNVQHQLVKDVVELHNDSFRRTLSTTLGRSMQRGKGNREITHSVQVGISDDYPASLNHLANRYRTDLLTAFRLLLQVRRAAEAAAYISDNGELMYRLQAPFWQADSPPLFGSTERSSDLNLSLAMSEVHRLEERLSGFATEVQDALYGQCLPILSEYQNPSGGSNGRVVLYWRAIAMVAADLEAETHEIARFALLHALAHAYCHLAMDTDGHFWQLYPKSAPEVREGVAGWYTYQIISHRDYGFRKAYVKLLNKIPAHCPQLTWQRWYERGLTNERVRRAMQNSDDKHAFILPAFEALLS